MNTNSLRVTFASIVLSFAWCAPVFAVDVAPIDPVRGRQLMQKASSGETLTADEQAYLERVKQAIRERAMGKQPGGAPKGPVVQKDVVNPDDWKALVPITDMTAPYKGED